jgi:hypothetical protein
MEITTLDFVAVVLAAGAVIEVWHKGSLFETARAYAQAMQDVTPRETLKGRLLELVNCPFCKSYHVPLYLFLLLWLSSWLGSTLHTLAMLVIYGLAATRLGNIIDSLVPETAKYTHDQFGDFLHGSDAVPRESDK